MWQHSYQRVDQIWHQLLWFDIGDGDHLSLASELDGGRAGFGLVGPWVSLERDVDAFVGDAKKRRVNELICIVVFCRSLSDNDIAMDDCLIDRPRVVLFPKQVSLEDHSRTDMDIESDMLWDEVSVMLGVRVWEPIRPWDNWKRGIHDLSGID